MYKELVKDKKTGVKYDGLLEDSAGGKILGSVHLILSKSLARFNSGNKAEHTLGGVFLHELLWHIHPSAKASKGFEPVDSNTMRAFYNLKIPNSTHVPQGIGVNNVNRLIPKIKL